jgi:hypothetical protein
VRVELFCAFCVILFLIVRPRMRAVLRVVRAARPYPQCHQAVRRGRLGERAAGDARGTRSEAAARRRPAGLPRSGSGGRPGWRRCLLPRHGRCGRRSTGTAGCCLAILVVTFCEIQCRARPMPGCGCAKSWSMVFLWLRDRGLAPPLEPPSIGTARPGLWIPSHHCAW